MNQSKNNQTAQNILSKESISNYLKQSKDSLISYNKLFKEKELLNKLTKEDQEVLFSEIKNNLEKDLASLSKSKEELDLFNGIIPKPTYPINKNSGYVNTYKQNYNGPHNNNTNNTLTEEKKIFTRKINNFNSSYNAPTTKSRFSDLEITHKEVVHSYINTENPNSKKISSNSNSTNNLSNFSYSSLSNTALLINSKTSNTIDFDSISNFCLILGIGNFNPFFYIKLTKEFFNQLKKEASALEFVVSSVSSNNDYLVLGPYNVLDLKNLATKKVINSTTEVKFIDVFKIKGKRQYVYLDEMREVDKMLLNIEIDNTFISIAEKLKSKQENLIKKEEELKKLEVLRDPNMKNNNTSKRVLDSKNNKDSSMNDKNITNSTSSVNNNETNKNNIVNEIIINEKTGSSQATIVKKKKKAKEINTKIGFYLQTKEEKEYDQLYSGN